MSRTPSGPSSRPAKRPAGQSAKRKSALTPRRLAAVGAVLALVVALVAAGIALGEHSGSGTRHPSGSAGSDAASAADPQQKLYTELDRAAARRQDGDALAVGKADAPVVLVEYADYQCSYCGKFTRDSQPELIKKYVDEGVLRIEFRNFPIFGKDSERAARASWAAGRQGKFWQFHDEVYAKTRKGDALAEDKLTDMARTAGVADLDRFRADLNGPESEAAVKKDQEQGYSIGVKSTPSFLVGGQPVAGAQPLEVFETAIARAKAAKQSGK